MSVDKSDKVDDMRKRAEEFWGKKSAREYALYALCDYLLNFQFPVSVEMGSHFAEDSIRRNDRFSVDIDYYGGISGDSLEILDALDIFRAKDSNPRVYGDCGVYVYARGVYRLSVDAEVYMEMNNVWREVWRLIHIQRGKDL